MQWLRNWACYIQCGTDETASHTSHLSGLISSLNSPSRLYWEAVLGVTRHTKDWTHDLLMTSPTLYLLRHSATSSVTKQHQLVPVKWRRHCLVGKVTVGLASCWPCISDLSGIHLWAQGLRKWDAHPAYTPPMSVTPFTFTYQSQSQFTASSNPQHHCQGQYSCLPHYVTCRHNVYLNCRGV